MKNIYIGKNYRKSSCNWPTQHTLPPKWYQIFADVLKSVIKPQLDSTPLGRWIGEGHQKWEYFFDIQIQQTVRLSSSSNNSFVAIDIDNDKTIKTLGSKPTPLQTPPKQLPTTPLEAVSQASQWMRQL